MSDAAGEYGPRGEHLEHITFDNLPIKINKAQLADYSKIRSVFNPVKIPESAKSVGSFAVCFWYSRPGDYRVFPSTAHYMPAWENRKEAPGQLFLRNALEQQRNYKSCWQHPGRAYQNVSTGSRRMRLTDACIRRVSGDQQGGTFFCSGILFYGFPAKSAPGLGPALEATSF